MKSLNKQIKIFLIATLVILVAGMAMLGILGGFNQSVDYSASYEMQVSVDQDAGKSIEVLKSSAEKALADNGLTPVDYASQELDEGVILVYKFNSDVSDKAQAVKTAVQSALDKDSGATNIKADVKVYKLSDYFAKQVGKTVLALGIAVAIIFVYSLIMNKLAGGVSVFCSTVLSVLVYLSIVSLTRLPAQPFLAILAGATCALSAGLSAVITSKYRSAVKENDKASAQNVAEDTHKALKSVYILILVAILVIAIIAGAIGLMSTLFLGLIVLVAGVSSVVSSIYMTPCIYMLIKGKKNK